MSEKVNGVPLSEETVTYDIEEQTGDPDDPSVDDVIQLALERARSPRERHDDAHLDEDVARAVEKFGEDAVAECIRLTLGNRTNRMAGSEAFGSAEYVHGIYVSVAATTYLRELQNE